jgi:hypothetical protein
MINQKCSNCGKENTYKDGEYKSREETLCKFCSHTLTVCGGYVNAAIYEELRETAKLTSITIFNEIDSAISKCLSPNSRSWNDSQFRKYYQEIKSKWTQK